jgi:hypothetical protein
LCRNPDRYCNLCCFFYEADKVSNVNIYRPCMFGTNNSTCNLWCCSYTTQNEKKYYSPCMCSTNDYSVNICCMMYRGDELVAPCCFGITMTRSDRIDVYDVLCCCYIEKINTIMKDENPIQIS